MALLQQFASTVGDGTGTVTGASNSSVTPLNLKVAPAAGQEYRVSSMTFLIEDNAAVVGDGIGAVAVLTNGIRIQVLTTDDVVLKAIDGGVAIKRAADFLGIGATAIPDATGTLKFSSYTIDFPTPIVLNGNTPSWLNVKFNDDLSALVLLRVFVRGLTRGQVTA
jgi:hypothetical protein